MRLDMNTYVPTGRDMIFASSYESPMPAMNVPDITVTFSSTGCQCAGIFPPAANRNWKTHGAPGLSQLPCTGPYSMPGANCTHLILSGVPMNGSGTAAVLAVEGVSVLLGAGFLAFSWAFAKANHNSAHITRIKILEKWFLNMDPPSKRNLAHEIWPHH